MAEGRRPEGQPACGVWPNSLGHDKINLDLLVKDLCQEMFALHCFKRSNFHVKAFQPLAGLFRFPLAGRVAFNIPGFSTQDKRRRIRSID